MTPAGISAYPDAMALGKCVIISSGPAVNGVLADEMVIIVPPGDPRALKEAIVKAYNNPELRGKIAKKGYEYAIALGGETQFMKSIVKELYFDMTNTNRNTKKIKRQVYM